MKVDNIHNPDLNAQIMAERLAYSLDRGRHYRKAGYYILRKVMDSGEATSIEIRITGKVNSQRERTQVFKAERKSKRVQSDDDIIDIGRAQSLQKFGKLRILVKIMHDNPKINDLNLDDLSTKFLTDGEAELEKATVEYTIQESQEEPTSEDNDLNH